MAAEVMAFQYLFDTDVDDGEWPRRTIIRPPFRHNTVHDLESIWWCSIWIFFFHYCCPNFEETKEHYEERKLATGKLFPGIVNWGEALSRVYYLKTPKKLKEFFLSTSWIDSPNITKEMTDAISNVIRVAQDIVRCYQVFESTFKEFNQTLPPLDCSSVCATMWNAFNTGSSVFRGVEMEPVKIVWKNATHHSHRLKRDNIEMNEFQVAKKVKGL